MDEAVRETVGYGMGYLAVLVLMFAGAAYGSASAYRKDNESATRLEAFRYGIRTVRDDFREMSRDILESYKELCDSETL